MGSLGYEMFICNDDNASFLWGGVGRVNILISMKFHFLDVFVAKVRMLSDLVVWGRTFADGDEVCFA